MSTSLTTMIRLRAIQNKTREVIEGIDDDTFRSQFHDDLSPLGWHLGHCMFVENYWLHEIVRGDKKLTKKLDRLYIPENCPKPQRGGKLPGLKKMLDDVQQQQDANDIFLLEMIPPISEHPLFKDEYLQNFLIQHYAQHYETMQMILNQIAIREDRGDYQPAHALQGKPLIEEYVRIEKNEFEIGGEWPMAYDNELPRHPVMLEAFNIASKPVGNAEFLHFMEQDGYQDRQYWSDEGWQWRVENNIEHPEYWRRNRQQQWYGVNQQGPFELAEDEPVYGISHFEAEAFANRSRARLPHENEWEAAVRAEQLHNTGKVWEWCRNTFYPYPGFTAFPYDGHSCPWFDENHYVLRGASRHTRPEIRRASFRNFFNPDKRHIFAGLRLVFD